MDLNSVSEVLPADVEQWRDGDVWLAGGTLLFSRPHPEVRRLHDLTLHRWPALTVPDDPDGALEIAATCTVAQLRRFTAPLAWPGLTALIRNCCDAFLASFKVLNVATVGGNLCAALPAGPMIALACALEGVCVVHGPRGSRRLVTAADFVTAPGRNALRTGEYLRAVRLAGTAAAERFAFDRFSLHPRGRSAGLVVGRLDARAEQLVVVVTASTPRPVVIRRELPVSAEALVETVEASVAATGWYDDVHGSPQWRRHLTRRGVAAVHRSLVATRPDR